MSVIGFLASFKAEAEGSLDWRAFTLRINRCNVELCLNSTHLSECMCSSKSYSGVETRLASENIPIPVTSQGFIKLSFFPFQTDFNLTLIGIILSPVNQCVKDIWHL